ncbi:class F sortase [Curtobacterium sp. VKM Ac-2922]|uniref:class F sortase n=1 Tax=Curtobacterium sp. VKM Ac-2922 TaxID=2929475 RepID=UPI001FB48FDD|nr:class F sortase [Curtobacterium sp. VKM Ac-2922]MCJ1713481.1 class F sortase [Curtobacterium sp. VKM Ac-2922]
MKALPATLLGLVAVAAVVGGLVLLHQPAPAPSAALDLDGRPVSVDVRTTDGGTATATPAPAQGAVPPDSSDRLVVPAVGLDVPLGTMSVHGGVVDPPGFAAAYQVVGLSNSVPTATGTYIAMHALRGGGRAPGNALWDTDAGRARIGVGDVVRVEGASWRVTSIGTPTKQSVPGDDRLWSTGPDELVLLTCLERPDGGPSTRNVVVTAERTG